MAKLNIMRTVRNKKELEEAIKARETEVAVEGKMFKLACKGAAKYQEYKSVNLNIMKQYCAVNAIGVSIVLVIIAAMTGLAIIAMCKKYNVEIDFFEGKMKISYDKI